MTNGQRIFQGVSGVVIKKAFETKDAHTAFVSNFRKQIKPALEKNERDRLKSEQKARATLVG